MKLLIKYLTEALNRFLAVFVNPKERIFFKNRSVVFPVSYCNAPLNTLFIDAEGKVSFCCFNRNIELANLSDSNIGDILKLRKSNPYLKRFNNKEFVKGCELCREKIINGLFHQSPAAVYDKIPVSSNFPTRLELELSFSCNFSCVMCGTEHLIGKKINEPANKNKLLQNIIALLPHVKQIKFLGGEPFYIQEYYDIWDEVIRINPRCDLYVQTNGSIRNKRTEDLLNKGKFHIIVSIDSVKKETFEKIRIGSSFDAVMTNLQFYQDYCKKHKRYFGVAISPLKLNGGELHEIVEYFDSRNICITFNRVTRPVQLSLKSENSATLQRIVSELRNVKLKSLGSVRTNNSVQLQSLITDLQSWAKDAEYREQFASLISQGKNAEESMLSIFKNNEERIKIEVAAKDIRNNSNYSDFLHFLFQQPDISFFSKLKNYSAEELKAKVHDIYNLYNTRKTDNTKKDE